MNINDIEKILSVTGAISMGLVVVTISSICVSACIEYNKEKNNQEKDQQEETITEKHTNTNDEDLIKTENGETYVLETYGVEL